MTHECFDTLPSIETSLGEVYLDDEGHVHITVQRTDIEFSTEEAEEYEIALKRLRLMISRPREME